MAPRRGAAAAALCCVAGAAPPLPPPLSGVRSSADDLDSLLSPIPDLPEWKRNGTAVGAPAPDSAGTASGIITINASAQDQTLLGFGGAFTEAASLSLANLSAADQEEVVRAYFASPEEGGNGYAIGRVHMNSCDFCTASYSFDKTANDTSLRGFDDDVTHDQAAMLPFMRRAIAAAPGGVKIFASPWSPPAWMKTNGRMVGSGKPGLVAADSAAWAAYFSRFFTAYARQGVKLWGLTVQNEPEYAAKWDACVYDAAQERDFVRDHLGPVMRRDHPDVQIMVYDHNRDHVEEWADTIFGDAAASQYADGIAVHWYVSGGAQAFANVRAVREKYPGKFVLATEACNCGGVHLRSWKRAYNLAADVLGDLNAGAVGWTDWNLVLNQDGGPHHSRSDGCDAGIIADPGRTLGAGTVIKQVWYYLFGHFSRYIRPGAVRVAADVPQQLRAVGVDATAFRDPATGRTAVVLINPGYPPKDAVFALYDAASGATVANLTLPANSVHTYVY